MTRSPSNSNSTTGKRNNISSTSFQILLSKPKHQPTSSIEEASSSPSASSSSADAAHHRRKRQRRHPSDMTTCCCCYCDIYSKYCSSYTKMIMATATTATTTTASTRLASSMMILSKMLLLFISIMIGTTNGFGGSLVHRRTFHSKIGRNASGGGRVTLGKVSIAHTTTPSSLLQLHLSSLEEFESSLNNNNDENTASSSNENDNESSSSLQLIRQWLLLHLPSLSPDDLNMYSEQFLEDGFDTVDKLENVNNNNNSGGVVGMGGSSRGGRIGSSTSGGSSGSATRLEDLYFMKKGHRRVLLQKIGKVREMKKNYKNRLRLFEEEEKMEKMKEESGMRRRRRNHGGGDDEEEEEGGSISGSRNEKKKEVVGVVVEGEEHDSDATTTTNDDITSMTEQDESNERRSSSKSSSGQSSSNNNNNNDDDDDDSLLISLTSWENKQLEEFVYNDQERDAMDEKSKRRLKEIEAYLMRERRNNTNDKKKKVFGEEEEEEEGGDEYDVTTFDKKQLVEFVYNQQTRDAMDDKSKRRLKEIEMYLKEKRRQRERRGEKNDDDDDNNDDNYEVGGDAYDMTEFEQKQLEEFVYNEQTRDAMDDKSKRRLKEIEMYLKGKRQQRERRGEKNDDDDNNDDDNYEAGGDAYDMTEFEQKQLEEFVYNEQTRDAMDDKSKRRLKEIEMYLKEKRQQRERRGEKNDDDNNDDNNNYEAGGDAYDMTEFEQKQLEEFVYNEETRDAMDDKSKRRLKEIEMYLKEKRQQRERRGEKDDDNDDDNYEVRGDAYDMTEFEQKQLEEFVYNEQTRDAMDDKSKRRLKEIEAYIKDQQRQQRKCEEEESNKGNDVEGNEDGKVGASLSSPSLPASWNFADLEDFMYTEQEREVMDDKGRRRLKEIEEYVRSVQKSKSNGNNYSTDDYDEELLDDFAARYQGILTARDEKKIGGTVGSSSVAKEEKRLQEFREAFLARQRNAGDSISSDDEDFMDDFVSRYEKLGTATADGVLGGSSEKSARRLKQLDAFLRARQSRQFRSLKDERETPLDDFEARYQTIGSSAADAVADGRSDKSSRRLRALDAFLKSRQSKASAAAEEEALRLELLQKPIKDLTATERKERIRVEEFQRRARIAQEKEASDTNVSNSAAAAGARRKSNEERRLEALNKWTAKQNELVEKRRIAKMLAEYERLMKGASKGTKKVAKPTIKEERSSSPLPLPIEDAATDDFFEKRRIHSMSTTLPPSNVGRSMQQNSQNSLRPGEEDFVGDKAFDISRSSFSERKSKSLSTTLPPSNKNAKQNSYVPGSKSNDDSCVGDECVDITRSSFSERESRSLSTTLPPSNENARANTYVPGSNDKVSDFLPTRSKHSNDKAGVDISQISFSERESKSLSTTLPPSNKNAKANTYVPGSIINDDDCVGDECADITRSSFPERESRSLSTTLPPSNENAKANTYVPGSRSADDQDCEGEECVDITRSSFPVRESRSLSTTLPPSNKNAKSNTYVPGSRSADDEDCVGDECVDITRSTFSERESKSLSTTLPPSNENAKTNSFTPESKKQRTSEEVEPEEYFDITTRLFQERPRSLSTGYQSVFKEEERSEMNSRASSLYARFQSKTSTPPSKPFVPSPRQVTTRSKVSDQSDMEGAYMDITQRLWDERASSFKEGEKSEMNVRRRPPKSSPRVDDAKAGSFSSLSRFVNTSTKRSSDDSSDYVDESERFSDRSSFVQSVNSGTNRKGMTSGSYKDRGATDPVSNESGDYVDESQRFSDRTTFVQSVNTGTAKRGTTSGSFLESKKRVRPGSSSDADDGYQNTTQNPFSRNRSSFVLKVNSGIRKIGTTAGSFRESKGRSEPEEKKYFSSDRSTLMGARTWRNEDVVTNNEHEKYLSSDRSSILGSPYIRNAGRSSDEHKKYMSLDRSSIVGAPSIRNAGGSSEEHKKYLTSDRSSLSGAPSIRRRGASNEYLDKNQFSSNLSPSSPVKASATNKLWRTSSSTTGGESSIDTPPAFMKNLDMLAGGRKIVKKRDASDDFLDKNSFSRNLAPSTMTQAATVASKNNNPYLNKNGFNTIDNMRTSNVSGAQFKRSYDVSPDEKKSLDNFDTRWAKLPDFDEMAGKSAVGENATGSRSPKLQEDEEYTMVGDFSRLERATSFVRDSNTAMKSNLGGGLSEIGSNDQSVSEKSSTTEDTDSEFEVMNWLLKNLPQLDEEDAVNYFVSLLEDGFDSTDMLDEVLEEDLYFMKVEHQVLLMKNLAVEEDEVSEAATVETKTTTFSESVDNMKKELEEASAWVAEKVEDAEDRRIAAELAEEVMDDAKEKEPAGNKRALNYEEDDEYTDITRANFGGRASLSSATPSLFEKDPTEDGKKPFSWQLDVRKEVTKGDDEEVESSDSRSPASFSDLPAEAKQLFQATPPVAVELEGRAAVSASVMEKRRSVKTTKEGSKSRPLFQATPPLMIELKEGMTAEEAALAREERLSGVPPKVDQTTTPISSQITEGMTADEAEAARSFRLATPAASSTPSVEATKEIQKEQKDENIPPPRGELHEEYIARGFTTEQAQKLKDYYTTWTIGPSHEMKFTSVFTCPMSGEHFASGIMDSGEVWGGWVWYKNKKHAMNAAAAKALDCFAFRESSARGSFLQRCDDEPYFEDETPTLSLPPNVVLPTELIQPDNS